jgi:bacteriocin-like protein
MSDQEKKQQNTISPQPDAENKKQNAELSEKELKKVTGGEGHIEISSWSWGGTNSSTH